MSDSDSDPDYRDEDMDVDEEVNDDNNDDDEEQAGPSRAPKRKKKSKITKASTARKSRIAKKVIGDDEYSRALGKSLFESLQRMDISGIRPEYADGTSPSMEEQFPGMNKDEVIDSLSKTVFLPIENCECKIAPCFDHTTQKSKSSFTYKRDLLLHIMYEHLEEDEDGKFKCAWLGCTCSTDARNYLIEHLCKKNHMDFRRWGCELCPARYRDLCALQYHMKVHQNEKTSRRVEIMDENDKPTNKFKYVPTSKHTPDKLIITFNNLINPLIIKEKSFLTQIQQQQKRYIEFRKHGEGYQRKCSLDGCGGVAVAGGLCALCQAIIGDIPPPYKSTTPQHLVNVNDDSPHYYLTEIRNTTGEWISICGNQKCCMLFTEPRNQSFCSEICEKYYETNRDEAFTHVPSTPPLITDLFLLNPSYDEVTNDSFTTNYDQTPDVVLNSPLPNRHLRHFFTTDGWKTSCVVENCPNPEVSGRLCNTCKYRMNKNPLAPPPLLKRKPPGHNFQVTINTMNNESSFTINPPSIIWAKEVYDGNNWGKKCAKWGCPNICSTKDPLLCRIHTNASRNSLPPFMTAKALREARARSSSSSSSRPRSPAQQQQQAPIILPPPPPTRPRRPRRARGASQ